MKKYFISALFIFGLAINAILQKGANSTAQNDLIASIKNTTISYKDTSNNPNAPDNKSNNTQNTNKKKVTTTNSNSTPTPPSQTLPPVIPASNGKYKNGTYTGLVADASYGNVQVQAVINNGKLSDVVVLQYPNDRQHSIQVANYSLPILKQEAISAQSANIDSVSGASYTSKAYIQSLSDALNQALN